MRRMTVLISQHEVAVDVMVVQQCSWWNWVSFTGFPFIFHQPFCCFLQLGSALAICLLWVEWQSYWGLDGWGGKWPRCVWPESWRCPGRSQPEWPMWCSSRDWALALLFTFCNFFFLIKMYGGKEHTLLFCFQSTKLYFCYFTFTYRQLCHWFSFRTDLFGFCTCVFLLFWYSFISLKSSIFLSCENTVSTTQQVLEQDKILLLNPCVL